MRIHLDAVGGVAGDMFIAAVTEGKATRKILTHLDLDDEPPPRLPGLTRHRGCSMAERAQAQAQAQSNLASASSRASAEARLVIVPELISW